MTFPAHHTTALTHGSCTILSFVGQIDGVDPEDILAAWSLEGTWTAHALDDGTNNLSWFVATPTGKYYLRVYQNTNDVRLIRFEHVLLQRLQETGLSFAVPRPLPTGWGETLARISTHGAHLFGALFPVVPGRHPDGADLAEQRMCGAALAELDAALSNLDLQPPHGLMPDGCDLGRVHASVPDPLDMIEHLPLDGDQRAQLLNIIHNLAPRLPRLYETLPLQIVHRDFDFSNVLMAAGRVTGILDFEFARPDVRALDLAIALSAAGGPDWSANHQRIAAFFAGYQDRLSLTRVEVEALPDLMRLFRVGVLIHREGRHRQGQARETDVLARARALLRVDKWLREHGEEVVW
jgi:homoserine kinase type II